MFIFINIKNKNKNIILLSYDIFDQVIYSFKKVTIFVKIVILREQYINIIYKFNNLIIDYLTNL